MPAAPLGDPGQGLPFGHGQMPYVFQGHAILIGVVSGGKNDVITYISCMTVYYLYAVRAGGCVSTRSQMAATWRAADLPYPGQPCLQALEADGLGGGPRRYLKDQAKEAGDRDRRPFRCAFKAIGTNAPATYPPLPFRENRRTLISMLY